MLLARLDAYIRLVTDSRLHGIFPVIILTSAAIFYSLCPFSAGFHDFYIFWLKLVDVYRLLPSAYRFYIDYFTLAINIYVFGGMHD